jgi:S-adenosylmethionine decarboxylase
MAYTDALFQLGMDLTRSSTAQKEDHGEAAPAAQVRETKLSKHTRPGVPTASHTTHDVSVERSGARFAGKHLLIDIFGADKLGDAESIEHALRQCVEIAGAELLHIHLESAAQSQGVSGVAVLAKGGHISIHTWPSAQYAALDVFRSGADLAELNMSAVCKAFSARTVAIKPLKRGEDVVDLAKPATVRRSRTERGKVRRAA